MIKIWQQRNILGFFLRDGATQMTSSMNRNIEDDDDCWWTISKGMLGEVDKKCLEYEYKQYILTARIFQLSLRVCIV